MKAIAAACWSALIGGLLLRCGLGCAQVPCRPELLAVRAACERCVTHADGRAECYNCVAVDARCQAEAPPSLSTQQGGER